MSIPVNVTVANPDPTTKFTTVSALVNLLRTLWSAQIDQAITTYIRQTATPNVEDQDKIWARLDGAGRPLGTYYFYNGFWVREAPPVGARIAFYTGNPTVDFDGTGLGLSGPGPVAKDYYGWALANGQNGTANLSNQFLVGGAMDNVGITGFSGGLWRTNLEGTAKTQGGETTVTLTKDNIPSDPSDALGAHDIFTADGNARMAGGDLWGVPAASGDDVVVPASDGNPEPDSFNIVPPYYAVAIIGWRGYA